MKLTTSQLKEIFAVLELSDLQKNKLINIFGIKIDLSPYISYSYDIDERHMTQSGEGLVKKELYNKMVKANKLGIDKTYGNFEVAKYCYLELTFDELTFSDDIDDKERIYLESKFNNIFDDTYFSDSEI